jgi:hypothetical protein
MLLLPVGIGFRYTLGSSSDNWGRTWTLANLSNANLRVRLMNVSRVQVEISSWTT